MATAMTGINIIMLPPVLAVASHAGIGPPIKWCIPSQAEERASPQKPAMLRDQLWTGRPMIFGIR